MDTVRDTSIKTFNEIQEEGFRDNWKEVAYNAVKETPLMTAREYFEYVITDGKREQIFPRLTELKKEGCIIEVGKRKCSVSGRTAYILATLEGAEKLALKKAGFIEKQTNLFVFTEEDTICYQDFRQGKRKSYAFTVSQETVAYKTLDCYNRFKEELGKLLAVEKEDGN